uniref:TGF-beta signaling molecule n=1 Tax=Ancylostoma caninum TaxID=29170 RepID=Q4PS75_ANCCA|nr:TGF-beta signaling molecule precursor [Ancylostoma caninum]
MIRPLSSSFCYRPLLFTCYLAALFLTVHSENCSDVCLEKMAQIRLEDIKSRLLSSMGMEEPPKVDHIDIPPSAIEQMIEGMEEQDDKLDEDAAEKTFIMAVDPSDGFDRETLVARFPVSMTTMLRKVAKAYLHVYLYVEEALPEPETVEVVVHERRLNGDVGDAVATKTVTLQRSTKVVVPLKSSDVERWWRSDPILGLYVVAMLNGQNIAVHPQEDRHARHTMFMSITLDTEAMSRRKRSPAVCMPEDKEPGCCLYDLTVDFQQMGWKFIIAPHKYNAYMCRGDCSLSHAHVARAGHTKVAKTGIITRQEATGNQGMCCHPAEYDAVRMIYMNADNQVTMARVPGMIARKCSCS